MGIIEKVVSVILFIAFAWIAHYLWEKRRSNSIRQIARDLGLDFTEKDPLSLIPNHEKFPLLSQGRGREIINRISGMMTYGEPVLFGYKYTLGSGKNSQTYSQTVVWFNSKKNFPNFELQPENLMHKISSIFGYADIDFQDRLVFSKQYLLRGEDTSGHVSLLFSNLITDYFEEHEGLCVESYGSEMLIYFSNRRLSAAEIPVFFQQAKNIYSLFNTGVIANDFSQINGKDAAIKYELSIGKIISVIIPVLFVLGFLFWYQNYGKSGPQRSAKTAVTSSLMEGWQAFEKTDYSQAISFYSKYIQKNPNDKDGFFYRGLAYEKIGDDIKAFQDFLQAIDFDPEYFDAYLHIDYLLAKESRYLEIITHWSAYIQRADTNGRAYLERGGAYFRSGKIDPALKDAKRACDLGEEHGCQLLLKYSNQ